MSTVASRSSRLVVAATSAATLSALVAVPAFATSPDRAGRPPAAASNRSADVAGPSPAGAGIPGHSGFSTSPTTPTGDEKAPPAAKRANEATGALGVALAKAKASGHAQPIADKTTAGQRSAPAAPERDLPAGRPALDGTVASSTTPKGATSTYSYTDHRLTSILGCGNPVEISGC